MLESLRVLVCSCLFLSVLIYAVVRLNWRQAPKVTQECRRTQRKSDRGEASKNGSRRGRKQKGKIRERASVTQVPAPPAQGLSWGWLGLSCYLVRAAAGAAAGVKSAAGAVAGTVEVDVEVAITTGVGVAPTVRINFHLPPSTV